MKLFESPAQKRQAIRIFIISAAIIAYTLVLFNFFPVIKAVRGFLMLFVPFYIGFIAAYLLNPLLNLFENHAFKKIKRDRLKRILSIFIVYLLLLAFLVGLSAFVLPGLVSSIVNLAGNIQTYYNMFMQTLENVVDNFPMLNQIYQSHSDEILGTLYSIVTSFTTYLGNSVPQLLKFTGQLSGTVINIFIGLIISVYMLLFKERIIGRSKRFFAVICKDRTYDKIMEVGRVAHNKTGKFIIGRIIDSMIMMALCYLFMSLFRFPFPLLNSVIVGVFNLVPVFGSIVSAFPTALIVLITKPSAVIYYIIFIIVIQQFDGNILGPKIQGSQLGISALWVMFSVLLFGGLFGVAGMIIGVPLFAVIYYFVDEAIRAGLIKKGKASETEDYMK